MAKAFRHPLGLVLILAIAMIPWTEALAGGKDKDRPVPARTEVDRLGDPLPPGALLRLGTGRLRVMGRSLAFAPDGKAILTASGARGLARWNAESGRLHREADLPGATHENTWFSPDGKLMAVAEGDKLGIWETNGEKRLFLLHVRPGKVAFSPDGALLATAAYKEKGVIRLWDLKTGDNRLLAELPSYANCLAFGPRGERLFAAVDNHSLRCWDTASGKQLWMNDHWASNIAVSPDGKVLAADAYLGRGAVALWQAASGDRIGALGGEKAEASGLAFSPDGTTLAQGIWRGGVRLWDMKDRTEVHVLKGAGPYFAFDHDSKTIATLGPLLQRWDVASGKPLLEDLRGHGHVGGVIAVCFAPDGKSLASYGQDDTVRLWDLGDASFKTLRADGPGTRLAGVITAGGWTLGSVLPLAFTPDGKALLTEVGEGTLALTDLDTGKERRRFTFPKTERGSYWTTGARLTAAGQRLLALGNFRELAISSSIDFQRKREWVLAWDVPTGREVLKQELDSGDFGGAVFSPDGRLLATSFQVYDLRTGAVWPLARGEGGLGSPFTVSRDGRLLAAAEPGVFHGPTKALNVFETLTGRRVMRVEADLGRNRSLAFSPDGRLLMAAGQEGLFAFESITGKQVFHLSAKGRLPQWRAGGFALCLAFAPHGRAVATGHADGAIHVWDIGPAWDVLAGPAVKANPENCWRDMAAEDPSVAFTAINRLAADPGRALPFLRKHLTPVKVDPRWLAERLKDLGAETFKVRAVASRDLQEVAEDIETDLRRALKEAPSLEAARRLEKILEVLPTRTPSGETLRSLRALTVLERIGSEEARAILRELAEGAPDARLTQEAKRALEP